MPIRLRWCCIHSAGLRFVLETRQYAGRSVCDQCGISSWLLLEIFNAEGLWPPQLAGLLMSALGMLVGSLLPDLSRAPHSTCFHKLIKSACHLIVTILSYYYKLDKNYDGRSDDGEYINCGR